MGLYEKAEKGKQRCPGDREPGTQYPTLTGRITSRSLAGKSVNGKKQKVLTKKNPCRDWWLIRPPWQPPLGNFGFVIDVHTSKHDGIETGEETHRECRNICCHRERVCG